MPNFESVSLSGQLPMDYQNDPFVVQVSCFNTVPALSAAVSCLLFLIDAAFICHLHRKVTRLSGAGPNKICRRPHYLMPRRSVTGVRTEPCRVPLDTTAVQWSLWEHD